MKKSIFLNGNVLEIPSDVISIHQLLTHLNLDHRILVVEQNQIALAKTAYNQPIQDRDQIEIIHFVGGG